MSRPRAPRKPRRRPVTSITGRVQPFAIDQAGLVVATAQGPQLITAGVVGDRVELRPGRGRHDPAEVARVIEPSPDRLTPPCPLLTACGACALQATAYPAQLAHKTSALRQGLEHLACPPEAVDEVVGLPLPFGQRTKLLMSAAGAPGALRFGFYRRGSLELVAAEGCPVQHPLALGVLAAARQVLDGRRIAPSTDPDGWLHAIGIRVDPVTGSCELTLAGRDLDPPGGRELVAQLAAIAPVRSVHLTATAKRSSYPLGPEITTLAGPRRMPFTVAGRAFALSPGTFAQTCASGADRLAGLVGELLPPRIRCLADLYGGAGTFSLLCRERWERAIIIDESASAIGDLQHQLASGVIAGAANVTALAGRLEELLGEVARATPDAAVLDPPRHGCKPGVIAALAALRPPVVLYVACGFASLLRDGRELLDSGYAIDRVAAVDMFPHTTHLEVVVRFVRE